MLHDGHRERLRERFAKSGLAGFAPHETLELLLTYAIPRGDVNPQAHALLNAFGSLHAVLEAPPEQLARVEGIGPRSAALIALMLPLFRQYQRSRLGERPRLCNRRQAMDYCRSLLEGQRVEMFYAVCLDAQLQVLNAARVGSGSVDEVVAYPRLVVDAALKCNAHSVLLAHNHPGGGVEPSPQDLAVTQRIAAALTAVDIALLDHMIVAGGAVRSLGAQEASASACDPPRAVAADPGPRAVPVRAREAAGIRQREEETWHESIQTPPDGENEW